MMTPPKTKTMQPRFGSPPPVSITSAIVALLCLLSSSPYYGHVSAQEGDEAPGTAEECVSPVALQECQTALDMQSRESVHLGEELTRFKVTHEETVASVTAEWQQKLNLAVETVQTERAQVEADWQNRLEAVQQQQDEACAMRVQQELQQVQSAEQSSLTAVQDELAAARASHAQELQQVRLAEQSACESNVAALRDELANAHAAHSSAAESHAAQLEQLEQAVNQERSNADQLAEKKAAEAVKEVQRKHQQALSGWEVRQRSLQSEHDSLKNDHDKLQRQSKRVTADLLQARQDLLAANEIVRLYHLQWYNRWIVLPGTHVATIFYDSMVVPVAQEVYHVGKPVLDPIYVSVVKPYIVPVMTEAWAVATYYGQHAWEVATETATLAYTEGVILYHQASEKVPEHFQAFCVYAWPRVQAAATTAMEWFQKAQSTYQNDVHPRLVTVLEPVQEAFETKVMPYWHEQVKPVVMQHLQNVQAALLGHWTAMAKSLHKMTKKYHTGSKNNNKSRDEEDMKTLGEVAYELTYWMAKYPKKSLETAELGVAMLLGLLFVRWLLFGKRKPKKTTTTATTPAAKVGGPTNGSNATKTTTTPTRGVTIQEPHTPPNGSRNNPKKNNHPRQRRHTPHPNAMKGGKQVLQ